MKTWIKMLIAVAVMAMMAACHPDEKKGNGQTDGTRPDGPEKSVYLSLNVALPPAGPAAKADDGSSGTEQGTYEENRVSSMLVVLAAQDGSYITHGTIANPTISGEHNNAEGIASMNKNGLTNYYSANGGALNGGKELINVFVFCNYTQELLNIIQGIEQSAAEAAETGGAKSGSDWLHKFGTVMSKVDENIWSNGYFLMSNQSIATRELPEQETAWQAYGDESKPFKLCGQNGGDIDNSSNTEGRGPVTVQRVMARIDLKDASQNKDWTFEIGTKGTADGTLKVKIERVALVNQSKKFFFLKHVYKEKEGVTNPSISDIATPSNSEICGKEIVKTDGHTLPYVVDADAELPYKQVSGEGHSITEDATSEAFMYPLFNSSGSINNEVRKAWKSASTAEFGEGYKTWTYTTENTTPHMDNRAGITTGIVFKGRLVTTDGVNDTLKKAANGQYGELVKDEDRSKFYLTKVSTDDERDWPLLYAFGETGRKIYVGWNDQVKKAALATLEGKEPDEDEIKGLVDGTIAYAYYTPCYDPKDPVNGTNKLSPKQLFDTLLKVQAKANVSQTEITNARETFKKAAVKAGFTVYQAGMAVDDFSDDEGVAGQAGDDAGYFCYYFYWIRHNLAESQSVVYPMEYAVVRNNVYKISIQQIRRFGHPRFPVHDPDPITVNTPCEKSEMYLSVEVKVADWVKRESSIIL